MGFHLLELFHLTEIPLLDFGDEEIVERFDGVCGEDFYLWYFFSENVSNFERFIEGVDDLVFR
jgi:hypothetical protein